jgi:hypothetical protein
VGRDFYANQKNNLKDYIKFKNENPR